MISVADCIDIINTLLPEPHAGLLAGMLFGTKAQLSPELKQALIDTGTIHITALSGMNISILVALTATTLLRVTSRRIASLLTLFIIIGFILFVGISPSVVRAGIMGSLSLLAIVFGRQQRALFFLGLTSLLMVIVHPSYLTDMSFQLSVGATLGILLFAKPSRTLYQAYSPSLPHTDQDASVIPHVSNHSKTLIPSFIHDDLKTTCAAQIFTIPLIALYMNQISLISPVANVLIGIVIAPLTILGLAMVALGFVIPPLSSVLSWIVWFFLSYLIAIVEFLAAFPYASIHW